MKANESRSRREFLATLALASSTLALRPASLLGAPSAEPAAWPIVVFSKVYQELKLGFDESAEVTAAVGLDGIDCPVRPGGQVIPERAGEELPRYAAALQQRNRKVSLLTTAIVSASSPHAETILRTAGKLGVKYYRTGYWNYEKSSAPEAKLKEIKAQLKDLAAMNKELGTCAILQNHAGTGLVGAKLLDYWEIVKEFDPSQIAVAFDIGHALNELPDTWPQVLETMQSHVKVAYVKDFKRGAGFVPFGQGSIGQTNFFQLLRKASYDAPVSMHIEYPWASKGKEHSKAELIQAMRGDLQTMKGWLRAA